MSHTRPKRKGTATAQDAVPVLHVYQDGVLQQKLDGGYAAVIEVIPISLDLLDTEERLARLRAFQNFLMRLSSNISIHMRDSTPDLSPYLHTLEERTHALTSRQLRAAAIELASTMRTMLATQRVREARFYIVIPSRPTPPAMPTLRTIFSPQAARRENERRQATQHDILLQNLREMAAPLNKVGLTTHVLTPEEEVNWLRTAYDPTRPPIPLRQASQLIVTTEEENQSLPAAEEEEIL